MIVVHSPGAHDYGPPKRLTAERLATILEWATDRVVPPELSEHIDAIEAELVAEQARSARFLARIQELEKRFEDP